ncbi:MAG TPA: cytochrome b/b6 domain-containing protein [Sphingomicrobium sp.]|nr:cytochrome b/b6 domain-containing protein [Sphingomicrobium sp.]
MSATASQANTPHAVPGEHPYVRVWDLPLRIFHWLLVIAIAVAFLSSEEDGWLNQWHILAGWIAGILITFRLVWGFVGGEHSRFADFVRPSRIGDHIRELFRRKAEPTLGHNPLGGISVVVLLALVAVTVWTGAFGGGRAEDVHEIIAWTLLAFVGLHIAAVVIMSVLQRENLVSAMITGRKSAASHVGATNARRPSAIGLLVTSVVLAGAVYGILQYDPQAFTLRRAESFERRATTASDMGNSDQQEEKD